MQRGRLKFFSDERGFGFVTPDDGSADVYVPERVWRECPDRIGRGDSVEFETRADAQKRLRVSSVRIADDRT